MLKKSASGVLASLRGSTYRSVRLAPSLAAALLDCLFEHPEVILVSALNGNFWPRVGIDQVFPQFVIRYGCPSACGVSRFFPNDRT